MSDGPQHSPDAPEPPVAAMPPMPDGPVLRYTPGPQSEATGAGRLTGGEQVWSAPGAGQPGPVVQPGGAHLPPPQLGPAKELSVAPAVLALVCGVLGVVVPLLPFALDQARAWVAFPFGVAGLVLGAVGCAGARRMKAMAIVGIVFSVLALVIGVIMVGGRIASAATT